MRYHPMKLPRWLVITLLSISALAILSVPIWWYVRWPERTAHEFADLLAQGRFEEAKKMIRQHRGRMPIVVKRGDIEFQFSQSLNSNPRSWFNLFCGRECFKAGTRPYVFTVECGVIVQQGVILPNGDFLEGDFSPLRDDAPLRFEEDLQH